MAKDSSFTGETAKSVKVVVSGSSGVTASQLKDFFRQIEDGSINGAVLQAILEHHRDPFGPGIIKGEEAAQVIFSHELMEEIYREFGIELDLNSSLWVEPEVGFWDVYMSPKLTASKLVDYLKKLDVTVYQSDENFVLGVRDVVARPQEPYRIRFRARIEADAETQNLSAQDTAERGLNCITLRERLFLEVLYFKATCQHLDVKSITRCDGSRSPDGSVPRVHWNSDSREVCVYWCSPRGRGPSLWTRVAVS